jgi:hypothetical protein
MEGRYTGSEGIRMAAEYIRKDFKEAGLQSMENLPQAYFQSFVLQKCYWQDQQMASGDLFLDPLDDFLFLSDPQDIHQQYEVVFAGFGLDDEAYTDYSDVEVQGRLVMAFSGEPRGDDGNYFISGREEPSRKSYYFSKMRVAREKGASGIMIIAQKDRTYRRYIQGVEDYRSRPDISYPDEEKKGDNEPFFTLFLSQEAAAELLDITKRQLKKARKKTEQERKSQAGSYRGEVQVVAKSECFPMNSENVIGYVQGTDLQDEAVVVVAHYDHLGKRGDDIYFGADDNASGTAAVMEVAEAFALAEKEGMGPRRTVIFMAVSAEELGLHGSRHYSEHPMIALDKTFACVNIDMIGRVSSKSKDEPDYIGGMAYVSEDILAAARAGAELAAPELEFRMTFRDRVSGGSDHYYFARNDIPSLFYFTGIHEDYHEPTDTPDKLLYDRMEGITRSIFTTVWELANREEKMEIEK